MEPEVTFQAHGSYVIGLRFSRDGRILISCGMDAQIKLWDTASWTERATFTGHQNSVNSLSLSPDEHRLASSSTDTSVRIWSFPDGRLLETLYDQKKVASGAAFSPDGKWLAAVYYGGRVSLWQASGRLETAFKTGFKNLSCLAFSPDSTLLATGGLGSELALWSIPGGEAVRRLPGHEEAVLAARFNTSGTRLVTISYHGVMRFWDPATWQEVQRWEIPGGRGFVFSPGERSIAVSAPSSVQIFSASSGKLEQRLEVATPVVNGLAFSPDGGWLAAGAADRKIRVFRL
jgi:WD40 repeat protein